MTDRLYQKYYFSRPGYVGGTVLFYNLCRDTIRDGATILEIGAGPSNATSQFLAGIGSLTGVDVSNEVPENHSLTKALVYDGVTLPFPDQSFDAVVSNWVLEHVEHPQAHFQEVKRVLRPGGAYCFRTLNLFHYVTVGSRLLPHSTHLTLANRLRRLGQEAHDPWPTFYRANTPGQVKRACEKVGLELELHMVESEPSYGRAHAALFYPMMMYERVVNSTPLLKGFRIGLFGRAWLPNISKGAGV